MSKQSLLLVDGDTRSLRVLEVSLRKAGFSVTPAVSVGDALDKLEINAPDLIISETKFSTELDGFELRRRLRATPDWAEIPFIFLTAETAIENKIKGLELGVDDYLTKPIYIKEIVTRINILLQKKQRQFLDLRKDGTRFAGRVADMPVVDVIQTIEVSRKSGVIQFSGGPTRQAAIYFRDGKVIDAEAGTLQGEDAVYRLLTWSEGDFEVEFRTVRRREVISTSSQGLLMEGMRRLDEWSRLLEQLPPLSHRFEIDAAELSGRLGEVPDDNNRILRLFDGKRNLLEVIDASDFGDLECLQAVSRLYFEGLLIDLDHDQKNKSDIGKPVPLEEHPPSKQRPPEAASASSSGITVLPETTLRDMPAASDLRDTDPSVPIVAAPKSVTMGWDAVPDPTEAPPAAPAVDTSQPAISPAELAASGNVQHRPKRDSSQAIEENDVVAEEEVHAPLTGAYRPSSLRKIDEAVAAAQLIEPSLFEPEELAALGIKPAAPAAQAQAANEEAQAIARVKLELRSTDPRIENARDIVEKTPAVTEAEAPSTNGASEAPTNGRRTKKTLPPPIPRAAAKPSRPPENKDLEEAPLLDSALLTSGEHRIPTEEEIDATELVEADLISSGEHKLPEVVPGGRRGHPRAGSPVSLPPPVPPRAAKRDSAVDALAKTEEPKSDVIELTALKAEAAAVEPAPVEAAADAKAEEAKTEAPPEAKPADFTAEEGTVASATAKKPDEAKADDDSGVPTVIEGDRRKSDADLDLADEGPTDPSRRRKPANVPYVPSISRDDIAALNMIGSQGKDRADAAGELKTPTAAAGVVHGSQRELVTIMPRRKTAEVPQVKAEDVAKDPSEVPTFDGKAKADAANLEAKAAEAAKDKEAKAAEAKAADAKPDKDAKDSKTDAKAEAKADAKDAKDAKKAEAKPEPKAKPAVEPPRKQPPRKTPPEGSGVVAQSRGPGSLAKVLIAGASVLAFFAVYSQCKKSKPQQGVVATRQDAALVATNQPDAADYPAFGIDAGDVANVPPPAPDAAVVQMRPDAAVIVQAPPVDAGVAEAPRDAAIVVATADAGVPAIDKNKEAKALADKARAALDNGDAAGALALLDQSLKLRRQPKTFVDRARALQRLNRFDDAIASINDAIKMDEYYAPAHEQKGMMLWSAQRYSEARPSLEMYLQLQPDGAKADKIRSMLDEPR